MCRGFQLSPGRHCLHNQQPCLIFPHPPTPLERFLNQIEFAVDGGLFTEVGEVVTIGSGEEILVFFTGVEVDADCVWLGTSSVAVGRRVGSIFTGRLQAGSSRMNIKINSNRVFRKNANIILPNRFFFMLSIIQEGQFRLRFFLARLLRKISLIRMIGYAAIYLCLLLNAGYCLAE